MQEQLHTCTYLRKILSSWDFTPSHEHAGKHEHDKDRNAGTKQNQRESDRSSRNAKFVISKTKNTQNGAYHKLGTGERQYQRS